jgi:hypothetical protein
MASTKKTNTNTKAQEKAIEKAHLEAAEAKLVVKYGDKIRPGTIKRGTGKYEGKLTVEINTVGVDGTPDGKTLRIATSDVHQVHHQEDVKAELRRQRARDRRAAKRAERQTEQAETSEAESNAALAEAL